MIEKFLGIIDILAAVLLYFGNVPGPGLFVNAIIMLLLAKGAVSLVYFPFLYIPGVCMGIIDVFAVLLIYFGTIPFSAIKGILIVIMLVKALPRLLMDIAQIVG